MAVGAVYAEDGAIQRRAGRRDTLHWREGHGLAAERAADWISGHRGYGEGSGESCRGGLA